MPFNDVYRRQVDLLVRTRPYVAEEECFALKEWCITLVNRQYLRQLILRLGQTD